MQKLLMLSARQVMSPKRGWFTINGCQTALECWTDTLRTLHSMTPSRTAGRADFNINFTKWATCPCNLPTIIHQLFVSAFVNEDTTYLGWQVVSGNQLDRTCNTTHFFTSICLHCTDAMCPAMCVLLCCSWSFSFYCDLPWRFVLS